jgi:excinuclease ABC subunit C
LSEDKSAPLQDRAWTGYVGDRSALALRIKEAPESPGVYVYRGEDGTILYVGKAKNLRNRLRSYFASTLAPKTEALMEKAASLETINVDSEKEALILELNLIKRHKPRYNILLRDDKQYPYIRVGVADKWPRVTLARRTAKDGARYFGPFTRAGSVRETLFLLRRIFPYRNCTDRALAQVSRPCLDYHIGRCLGPCTGTLDESAYAATIDEVVKFLEGRLKEVRGALQKRMSAHAENMEFEAAARVRDQIKALDDVTERQKITTSDMKDRDVLGLARSGETAFVSLLTVREGKLLGKEGFILSGAADQSDSDILEAFISQYYSAAPFYPPEILIPTGLPSVTELEEMLSEQRKAGLGREGAVHLRAPVRGKFRELMAMAEENARAMLAERVPKEERETEANQKAMEDLATALGAARLPSRIEGYDISNITGKEAVASMVVLKDGKPDKSSYRKFKMKIDGKPNDFAMMQEVLWRRFRKGMAEREKAAALKSPGKFATFPDLVIVDGGKGQVSAAKDVFDELKLDIPLAGLAKKNEELFLPDRSDPIVLPRDSGALYLVVRLRDEAHRFAVGYHRTLRGQKATRSVLLDIPGIGPSKVKDLLTAFADIEVLRMAPVSEIAKVKGIGTSLAQSIHDHLNARRQDQSPRPR